MELDLQRDFTPTDREFIRRESERLLEDLNNPDTPHPRRSWTGERLAAIGDPRPGVGLRSDGLPDIDWCRVEVAGKSRVEVQIETLGNFKVDLPFCIARYPVTYKQFQAFIDSSDGYYNREVDWFEGLGRHARDRRLGEQGFKFSNYPRETVNWYQAMAFCRWMSWRLEALGHSPPDSGATRLDLMNSFSRSKAERREFDIMDPFTWTVRLPTEAEWQFAAAGRSINRYPWGNDWDGRFANTSESGLGRTTAVGMYIRLEPRPAGRWI